MIYEYEITLKFETDRKLTQREKDDLQALVSLQALEPTSLAGEDEEYRTSAVYVDIVKEEIWYSPTSTKEENEIMKCAICEKKKGKRRNLFSVTFKNEKVQACNTCITENYKLVTGWSL